MRLWGYGLVENGKGRDIVAIGGGYTSLAAGEEGKVEIEDVTRAGDRASNASFFVQAEQHNCEGCGG